MSPVTRHVSHFFFGGGDKTVKLVVGGFVKKGAYPVKFFLFNPFFTSVDTTYLNKTNRKATYSFCLDSEL